MTRWSRTRPYWGTTLPSRSADTVSDDTPAGTIIGQSPAAGSTVKEEMNTITVTVSSGPEIILMPDVLNKEYLKAVSELVNMQLDVSTPYTYRNSSEIAKDHIIETRPMPGTPLSPGDEVTIVISSGPEIKSLELPNYKDRTRAWTEDDLKLRNLVPNVQEVYSDTVEAGTVIDPVPRCRHGGGGGQHGEHSGQQGARSCYSAQDRDPAGHSGRPHGQRDGECEGDHGRRGRL